MAADPRASEHPRRLARRLTNSPLDDKAGVRDGGGQRVKPRRGGFGLPRSRRLNARARRREECSPRRDGLRSPPELGRRGRDKPGRNGDLAFWRLGCLRATEAPGIALGLRNRTIK